MGRQQITTSFGEAGWGNRLLQLAQTQPRNDGDWIGTCLLKIPIQISKRAS